MISAVKELGELILENSNKTTISTIIENVDRERYPNTICVVLQKNEPYHYIDVILEETNAVKSEKYLYRKGSPRGSNFSPTALITEVDKTYAIKFIGWFVAAGKNKEIDDSSKIFFGTIKKSLETNQDLIIQKIKELVSRPKDGYVLTLKLDGQYLGDISYFKNIFLKSVFSKEEEICSNNRICSVCGQKKEKVYGGASPFRFYTIDKPGFISGEFNELLSWRNFPVCPECYLALIEGKNILKDHLTFSFYGLNYMLIPNIIFGKNGQLDIADILINKINKKIVLSQNFQDNLTTNEDDILKILAEVQDNGTFHFLFLQPQQSAERILLIIEDILPSRLRRLFMAKKEADRLFPKSPFHVGKIRYFLGKSDPAKSNPDLDKYFLEVINSVFKGNSIEFKFLLTHYMREIRKIFLNDEDDLMFKVNDAIQTTYFLSKLGLLVRKEGIQVSTVFDEVLNQYIEQLETNEKRGIFLLGALTKRLLNIQWGERKSQPFISQLKGLKMNGQDIRGLLPKVEIKLIEYKQYKKKEKILAEEISRLLLSAESKEALTVDEINFFFVCGMNLYQDISDILYGEKEKEDNTDDSDEQI